jgi:PAS domain S-box-containing protein
MTDNKFNKSKSQGLKKPAGLFKKNDERSVEEKELHRTLVLNSSIGIYVVQNGRFKFVNPKFQEYIGFSKEELSGTESLGLVHPEDREMVRQNAVLMLKGKLSQPYEFRIINKKGENLWVMETVTSITYGGQRAALGNNIEITRQKAMEAAIRESEERFRTIIETIEDGYGEVDIDGNNIFSNESF